MQSKVYSIDKVYVETLIVIPEIPPAMAISVEGWVPTSGWSQSDLTPWLYVAPPADGILDLDFVATAPTGLTLQVFSKITVAKAFPIPNWVIGVRVHSSTNTVTALLGGAVKRSQVEGEGMPLPWPFPWWSPKAKIQGAQSGTSELLEHRHFIESFAKLVRESEVRQGKAMTHIETMKARLSAAGKAHHQASKADHQALDAAYDRLLGEKSGAPGWAHDLLDAIWDFAVWILS